MYHLFSSIINSINDFCGSQSFVADLQATYIKDLNFLSTRSNAQEFKGCVCRRSCGKPGEGCGHLAPQSTRRAKAGGGRSNLVTGEVPEVLGGSLFGVHICPGRRNTSRKADPDPLTSVVVLQLEP